MTGFDLSQVDKLLTTTRAVRKRLDLTRPVPRELVLECIQVALQAPTGGNVQQWRWLAIDDPDKKAIVADAYRRSYAPYIESQKEAVQHVGRTDKSTLGIIDSSMHLANVLHEVPVHVIPCALGHPPTGGTQGNLAGWYGSILPAVWSFCLAARARGLGTAWTTLHLGYEREVGDALGIPDTVSQMALIPVAYYTGDDFKAGSRKDAAEVTYWNAWKQKG
jgi:nitroreductase